MQAGSLGHQAHLEGLSKSQLMHIKSGGVERGVLQTKKVVPFIFISLELSQELGTKIKYYNQKDAPIPLSLGKL